MLYNFFLRGYCCISYNKVNIIFLLNKKKKNTIIYEYYSSMPYPPADNYGIICCY